MFGATGRCCLLPADVTFVLSVGKELTRRFSFPNLFCDSGPPYSLRNILFQCHQAQRASVCFRDMGQEMWKCVFLCTWMVLVRGNRCLGDGSHCVNVGDLITNDCFMVQGIEPRAFALNYIISHLSP